MKEKRVLITGAAGGLGRSLALEYAGRGANLFLLDKDSNGLDSVSDQVRDLGYREPGICPLDLTIASEAEYEQIGLILESEFAGLDVLIHCAAEFKGLRPLDQQSAIQWQHCMQVNVNAAWHLTMTCLPHLRQSAQGRVVFILEDPAKTRTAYWGAYGVSKAALASLSRILSQELENTNVKVIEYSPPPLRTPLRAQAYLSENPRILMDPNEAAETLAGLIDSSTLE